jgi:hypothetical protein
MHRPGDVVVFVVLPEVLKPPAPNATNNIALFPVYFFSFLNTPCKNFVLDLKPVSKESKLSKLGGGAWCLCSTATSTAPQESKGFGKVLDKRRAEEQQ